MPDEPPATHAVAAPESVSGRFVFFGIAGDRWALPVEAVCEVQQIVAFATLPAPDGALVGYLDLRGEVVGVVDGRRLLGKEPAPMDPNLHLIVVTDGLDRVALVVDAVRGVGDALSPRGASAPSDATTQVGAFVRDGEGLVPIPDVAALMAAGRGSAGL
jgi:purine-binding chemotaxis protein CheW